MIWMPIVGVLVFLAGMVAAYYDAHHVLDY
jgi:hypothetical protein